MKSWIRFEEQPIPPGQKTKRWLVETEDGNLTLGTVKWYGAWRCYSFFPSPATLFEQQCLRDIADFVAKATAEHKSARLDKL